MSNSLFLEFIDNLTNKSINNISSYDNVYNGLTRTYSILLSEFILQFHLVESSINYCIIQIYNNDPIACLSITKDQFHEAAKQFDSILDN